jgi:hypothetical protein
MSSENESNGRSVTQASEDEPEQEHEQSGIANKKSFSGKPTDIVSWNPYWASWSRATWTCSKTALDLPNPQMRKTCPPYVGSQFLCSPELACLGRKNPRTRYGRVDRVLC